MRFNIAAGLIEGIKACETWQPEIEVHAQLPNNPRPVLCNLVEYICPNPINFFPDPNYPKDSSIRFIDFKGVEKEKDLERYLVEQALQGGTDLSIAQSYNNQYKTLPENPKDVRYVVVSRIIPAVKYILATINAVLILKDSNDKVSMCPWAPYGS